MAGVLANVLFPAPFGLGFETNRWNRDVEIVDLDLMLARLPRFDVEAFSRQDFSPDFRFERAPLAQVKAMQRLVTTLQHELLALVTTA
ncbi:hypothetical protein [Mesorhizobium cantuariense]|uniref:Uncharacterized protein n=1 Tax=Mesorhizobium cantuariense TaxID=1300275 RepID=A0ABV7MH73_9HYPH